MPKTTSRGQAKQSELPSTLQRSSAKAQRTFAKAHDTAAEQYGDAERAHRVAYAALKPRVELPLPVGLRPGLCGAQAQLRAQGRPLGREEAARSLRSTREEPARAGGQG